MFGFGSSELILLLFAPLLVFNSAFLSLFGFAAAIIAGFVANSKGRNWGLWGLFSFFFPFLIVILLFLKQKPRLGHTELCPACKEIVKYGATKCKHCGENI